MPDRSLDSLPLDKNGLTKVMIHGGTIAVIDASQVPSKITGKWLQKAFAEKGIEISVPTFVPKGKGDCSCIYASITLHGSQQALTSDQNFSQLHRAMLKGENLVISCCGPDDMFPNRIDCYLQAG